MPPSAAPAATRRNSRAKERVFSFRNAQHAGTPSASARSRGGSTTDASGSGESIRVFPLSNWTELDVWLYIHQEQIPVVPLYFAAPRPVVERDGMMIMVDDDRLPLRRARRRGLRTVRFRTFGCYPLTGAIETEATSVADIVRETVQRRFAERRGRAIDQDGAAAMERKKQEGYF